MNRTEADGENTVRSIVYVMRWRCLRTEMAADQRQTETTRRVHPNQRAAVTIEDQSLREHMEETQTAQDTILQRIESLSQRQDSLIGMLVIQSALLFAACGLVIVTWMWLLLRWPAWRKEIVMG